MISCIIQFIVENMLKYNKNDVKQVKILCLVWDLSHNIMISISNHLPPTRNQFYSSDIVKITCSAIICKPVIDRGKISAGSGPGSNFLAGEPSPTC